MYTYFLCNTVRLYTIHASHEYHTRELCQFVAEYFQNFWRIFVSWLRKKNIKEKLYNGFLCFIELYSEGYLSNFLWNHLLPDDVDNFFGQVRLCTTEVNLFKFKSIPNLLIIILLTLKVFYNNNTLSSSS